jgi:hypothetical protein
MKRWYLAAIVALGLTLAASGSAAANKNQGPISATCDGKPVTVRVNFRSNNNAAAPVVGGGSFKVIEGHFFLHGTNQEVFSFTTNFPKEPSVTCNGSFTDPMSGELLDFTVTGVLRP